MKYPNSNFLQLIEVLKQLAPYFELGNIQPNQLHYLAYQQTSKGQPHNKLYLTDQGLKRAHSMDKINVNPIVNVNFELELYPNGCNDTNIETATKKAIKIVLINGNVKHKK